jgi:hypothetical protein
VSFTLYPVRKIPPCPFKRHRGVVPLKVCLGGVLTFMCRAQSTRNSALSHILPQAQWPIAAHVLEEALKFYLKNVVPSQHLVRREVMDALEDSVAGNRELLERPAK